MRMLRNLLCGLCWKLAMKLQSNCLCDNTKHLHCPSCGQKAWW